MFLEDSLQEATEDMRVIENLNSELASIEPVEVMRAKLKQLETLNSNLESKYFDLENILAEVRIELASSAQEVNAIKDELRLMQQSISWRITSPLRSLKSWMRK